jgi:hypothetical protein
MTGTPLASEFARFGECIESRQECVEALELNVLFVSHLNQEGFHP